MRVLGLHVKGGVLNYGLVEGQSGDLESLTPIDEPRRLAVDCGLAGARQLADLADRFEQDLRSMRAEHVALLATRRHAQWKYADAWDRISRIAVVMLACDRHGVPFQEVKTEAVQRYQSAREMAAALASAPVPDWTSVGEGRWEAPYVHRPDRRVAVVIMPSRRGVKVDVLSYRTAWRRVCRTMEAPSAEDAQVADAFDHAANIAFDR